MAMSDRSESTKNKDTTVLESIGTEGTSGLTDCQTCMLTHPIASTWIGIIITGGMRTAYVAIFGGDPSALGIVFFLVALLEPFFFVLSLYFYWTGSLNGLFPVERWGRYAGPMLCASILLAGSSFAIFMGNFSSRSVISLWAFVFFSLATFAKDILFVGNACAEIEIFPFASERMKVVMCTNFSAIMGIIPSAVMVLWVLSSSESHFRVMQGLICGAFAILFVIPALNPLSKAQQPEAGVLTGCGELFSALKVPFTNDAFLWMAAATSLENTPFAINLFFCYLFLTLNLKYYSWEAGTWFGMVAVVCVLINLACAGPMKCIFGPKERHCLLHKCTIIGAILQVCRCPEPWLSLASNQAVSWVAIMSWADSPGWMLFAYGLQTFFGVPGSFFQNIARDWVSDEDIHTTGVRRESLFICAFAIVMFSFANVLPPVLLFILGQAGGYDPQDCSSWDPDTTEAKACEDAERALQPDRLDRYIRWVQLVPAGVLWAGAAICWARFPIAGERLETLQINQAECFKKVDGVYGTDEALEVVTSTEPEVTTKSELTEAAEAAAAEAAATEVTAAEVATEVAAEAAAAEAAAEAAATEVTAAEVATEVAAEAAIERAATTGATEW